MGNIGYRIRNCFTLGNVTTLFFGVGVTMVGIFAPRVLANIPQEVAVGLFALGIGLIVIALGMVAWKYLKNPIEKKLKVFSIITVLDKMYRRLELLMNEERNKQIDEYKYLEFVIKANQLMQLPIPEVLSLDEVRTAVEDLEKKLPSMYPVDARYEDVLKRAVSISRLMDKSGVGLKERRKADKKYGRLLSLMDEYYDENKGFIDQQLRSFIEFCVDFNESATNFLLYVHHSNMLITSAIGSDSPSVFTPSMEAGIEGFNDDVRKIARAMRVKISEKIKRLIEGNAN
jgi:hypothetical protein